MVTKKKKKKNEPAVLVIINKNVRSINNASRITKHGQVY